MTELTRRLYWYANHGFILLTTLLIILRFVNNIMISNWTKLNWLLAVNAREVSFLVVVM